MPNPADAVADRPAVAAPGFAGLLESWRQVVLNGNLAPGRRVDAVSRWLLITRACVFPMTLTSGAIGAEAYVRTQYAPHPLFSGLVTKRGLLATIAACNLADLAIGIVLLRAWGWPVAAFALAGLFVSVFYVAPPLKLKHHGLGEPGVFLVWGPLMTGGTYFVTAGSIPAWVWLASLPYALSVTTVLIGKHIDKYEQDGARGIHTLPVLLGKHVALRLNMILMVALYPARAALVPRLRQVLKAYGEPKPAAPPPGYRLWPLWFVSLAFYHGRLAGGLF